MVGPSAQGSPEAPLREACLVVLYGESIGRRIPLGRVPLSIGRAPSNELHLEEESVSRRHCEIRQVTEAAGPGAWHIVDVGSTNGTFVNDRPAADTALHHGDQIQVGRTIFKFLASGHIESAYHEEIYRLVTTDGLTGLANRRAFDEALSREFSRANRYSRPVSLLMIDLDHFKRVNDVHGHLAGDAALRQVGVLLRTNIRRDDLAGRLGGEEFGVLLPEIDQAGALRVGEKLLGFVRERRFVFEGVPVPLTISVGAATRSVQDRQPQDLVRRADEALYTAKRSGRDRVQGSSG